MAPLRFSPDEVQALAADYLAGYSAQQIADKHGAMRITVIRTLRRHGVPIRPSGGSLALVLTPEDEQSVVARYQDGDTIAAIARDYGTHYSRISGVLRKHGVHLRPRSWKGGRTITRAGYVMVHATDSDPIAWAMATSNGYVMEHRLVMAHHLGRPLQRTETVHHINGDKHDNGLSNLQLHSGHHGNGVVRQCGCCGSFDIREVPIGEITR